MNLSISDTRLLIPQREPFVMIDELLETNEQGGRSAFTVRKENIFVENGYFLEAGLLENIAQTAAAHAGYQSKNKGEPVAIGYIGAVKNFEVFELPATNDQLETDILIENQVFNVTIINGKVRCGDRLLAQCEMKIFITPTK